MEYHVKVLIIVFLNAYFTKWQGNGPVMRAGHQNPVRIWPFESSAQSSFEISVKETWLTIFLLLFLFSFFLFALSFIDWMQDLAFPSFHFLYFFQDMEFDSEILY